MDHSVSAESQDLLSCFFQECESQFRFLEEEHGYLCLSGLMEYKDRYKVIKPYQESDTSPDEPFYAVTRYERNAQAIEILYGDKNYILEVFVFPDSVQRFSVRDLVLATRKDFPVTRNVAYLTETHNIRESLKWFAKNMRKHPKVLEPSEKLIEKATVMRDTLLEQGVRSHLEKMVKNACIQAAEAFVKKDYERVVSILDPYESYLNASDLKKLRISKEKLS